MLWIKRGQHKIGDMIKGFVYTGSHQKARLTTANIETTHYHIWLGILLAGECDRIWVFLDVGLPDKQFVVSLDVLQN